jgi:hypothetical protein
MKEAKSCVFTKNNEISRHFNEATQAKLRVEELENEIKLLKHQPITRHTEPARLRQSKPR